MFCYHGYTCEQHGVTLKRVLMEVYPGAAHAGTLRRPDMLSTFQLDGTTGQGLHLKTRHCQPLAMQLCCCCLLCCTGGAQRRGYILKLKLAVYCQEKGVESNLGRRNRILYKNNNKTNTYHVPTVVLVCAVLTGLQWDSVL